MYLIHLMLYYTQTCSNELLTQCGSSKQMLQWKRLLSRDKARVMQKLWGVLHHGYQNSSWFVAYLYAHTDMFIVSGLLTTLSFIHTTYYLQSFVGKFDMIIFFFFRFRCISFLPPPPPPLISIWSASNCHVIYTYAYNLPFHRSWCSELIPHKEDRIQCLVFINAFGYDRP